jgi:hypothetical protein
VGWVRGLVGLPLLASGVEARARPEEQLPGSARALQAEVWQAAALQARERQAAVPLAWWRPLQALWG